MPKPFRVGRFRAIVDDSGERDGWWIRDTVADLELFVVDRDLAKLRRLLERVEAYERRRPSRRAA